MTPSKPLTIYGAVTPPRTVSVTAGFKRTAREGLDRLLFRIGRVHHLTHQNHISSTSFNRGDLATSLAVKQTVANLNSHLKTRYLEWGQMHAVTPGEPVLIGGSGYFFLDRTGHLPDRVAQDGEQLRSRGSPYGFYGVGVNHVGDTWAAGSTTTISPRDTALVRQLLGGAMFISVRDQQSLNALQPLVDTPVALVGDPALFLDLEATSTPVPGGNRPRIGINLPFHGPAASERIRHDLPKYVQFLRRLQSATGAELVQTIHFDAERLIGKLIRDSGVQLTEVNGTVEELQSAYASLDLHVGGMLHSCILACSVGTPCIGLAYDIKHFGFFDLMEMTNWCLPARPFDADQLLARCDAMLQMRQQHSEHIIRKREALRANAQGFLHRMLPTLWS